MNYDDYTFEEKKKERTQINIDIKDRGRYLMWRALCKNNGWNQSYIIRECLFELMEKAIKENNNKQNENN